jgi:hypothetical protein
LQAVQVSASSLRKYARLHGHFPKSDANLAELGEFSLPPETAAMIEYGGRDSLNLTSAERIIILKCVLPVSSPTQVKEFYCGLLSGEILRLSEKDAVLGRVCPPGAGAVAFPKP